MFYNSPWFNHSKTISDIENITELEDAFSNTTAISDWFGDSFGPKFSIYYPGFSDYDIVICVWIRNRKRILRQDDSRQDDSYKITKEFYGYQLKQDKQILKNSVKLERSYLICGKPAELTYKTEDGWTKVGRNDLETFFGLSGTRWLPEQ